MENTILNFKKFASLYYGQKVALFIKGNYVNKHGSIKEVDGDLIDLIQNQRLLKLKIEGFNV